MNKFITYWFFMLISTVVVSAQQTQMVNGNKFEIIHKNQNDTIQRSWVELHYGNKKLVSHITFYSEGDCSSENLELGTFEIKNNQLILYSYWASGDRMGVNIFPFGFRKQVYKVSKNGEISLLKSEIYLEITARQKELLDAKSLSNSEKNELRKFTKIIENEYQKGRGIFVEDEKKELLEQEVRFQLKEEILLNTKCWDSIFKIYKK